MQKLVKEDKEELAMLLRKGEALTAEDQIRFQYFIRESGALQYAQDLAKRYISEGRKAVLELEGMQEESREFLISIADYMIRRDS